MSNWGVAPKTQVEADKKKIAAMTAVLYYLQAEQEAMAHGGALLEKRTAPSAPAGFWSYSTRQAEMMHRNMIQMRQMPAWNK
jgi:hypothetical protein